MPTCLENLFNVGQCVAYRHAHTQYTTIVTENIVLLVGANKQKY